MARQLVLDKFPAGDELAKVLDDSVLPAYLDSVKYFNSERAREVLSQYKTIGGELAGLNPFADVHLQNYGLLPKGERMATWFDLNQINYTDLTFLRDNLVYFGLELITEEDSYEHNNLLAKTLAAQLKDRGIELGRGKLIPYSALKVVQDPESYYGLVFNLNENASKENIIDSWEFPFNYKRREGLSIACFEYEDWTAEMEDLTYFNTDSRIVVVGPADLIRDGTFIDPPRNPLHNR